MKKTISILLISFMTVTSAYSAPNIEQNLSVELGQDFFQIKKRGALAGGNGGG